MEYNAHSERCKNQTNSLLMGSYPQKNKIDLDETRGG